MTLLICLPLILFIAGLAARRWFVATRQDIRSIESHRSTIGHLEHLAPGEAPPGATAGSAHVRIVGQAAGADVPPVRPMVWGRPDGRPPAARPAWHSARAAGASARYEKARIEAEVEAEARAERRPTIVITDAAVADARPDRATRRPAPERSEPRRAAPAPSPAVASAPNPEAPSPAPESEPAAAFAEAPAAADVVVIGDVEAAPVGGPGGPGPAVPASEPARPRRHRRPPSGGHRSSRVLAAAAALVVVAAGAAVAAEELQGRGVAHPVVHSAAPATGPTPSVPPPTSAAAPAPTTPPTLAATSTSATDAVYTVTSGSLDVSLAASAPCWVELRTGSPTGPVAYEGTLPAGANQKFSAGNGLWLRLGDPAGVQLTINGAVVSLPAAANPFNITVTSA